jgi:polyketide biosynthesis enoyl-CoA hydratase PksI
MGATHVLPLKLGPVLATEMLFATRNYRGADLERRGIAFPVLPRTSVLTHACELAVEIAEKPRSALVVLKDHLVAASRQALPEVVRKELQMHDKTFHEPAVRERIAARFGQ